ncbi:MAG TPA: hypothetical protein PKE29_04985 [Phycisphaerales bacterium]|nr:hypothetical protein [Phycisphaerales bacterium]
MARSAPEHICPRCGYDVSGIVPTWAEACPLEGICTECGLAYEWVDIFRPERIYPSWSYEHARRGRFRALVRRLLRIPTPGRLWRQMRLAAPVRVRSLALIAMLAVLASHTLVVAIRVGLSHKDLWGVVWVRVGTAGRTAPVTVFNWGELLTMAIWPYTRGWERLVGPLGLILLLWALLAPLPFFVLEQTMARSKVRRVHLLRGWAYSLVVAGVVLVVDAVVMGVPIYASGSFSLVARGLWTMLGLLLFVGAAG